MNKQSHLKKSLITRLNNKSRIKQKQELYKKALINKQDDILLQYLNDPEIDLFFDDDNYIVEYIFYGNKNKLAYEILKNKKFNPAMDNNEAVCYSCQIGNLEMTKFLLLDSRVDPSSLNNFCIQYASYFKSEELIALLLNDKRVDPTDNNNVAIKNANKKNNIMNINLLWEDKRVKKTLINETIKYKLLKQPEFSSENDFSLEEYMRQYKILDKIKGF
jgi:hypothetical protein